MTSILLRSDEVSSGNASDGTFVLPTTISGNYTVVQQYFNETEDVPWIWEGINVLAFTTYPEVVIPEGPSHREFEVTLPVLSLNASDNLVTVVGILQTTIQAAFDTQEAINAVYGRDVTVTADTISNTITMTFAPISVLIRWNAPDSTANEIFGKPFYEEAAPQQSTSFVLTAKNINLAPELLEFYIEESNSYNINSHGTFPTLLMSVDGDGGNNQTFAIPVETNTITFQIFRPNITYEPIPITSTWIMYIRQ